MHNKQIPPPDFCAFCTKISNSTVWERWYGMRNSECGMRNEITRSVYIIDFEEIVYHQGLPCISSPKVHRMRNLECGMWNAYTNESEYQGSKRENAI